MTNAHGNKGAIINKYKGPAFLGLSGNDQKKILMCFAIGLSIKMVRKIDKRSAKAGLYVAAISIIYRLGKYMKNNNIILKGLPDNLLFFLSGFLPELLFTQLSVDSTILIYTRSSNICDVFKRVKSGQYILFFLVNLLLGLIIYTKPKYLEAKYLSFLEQTTTLDFDKGLKHFRNPNPCCKDSHPDHKSCLGHAIHTIPKNFLEIAKIYGLLHGITFLFHKDPQKFLNQVTKSIMFYMMYATVGRSVYCAHGKLVKGYYPNLVQFMVIWTVATSSVFLENKHRVPEYSLFLLSKVISGVLRICSGVKGSEYLPHDRIISSVLLGLTFVNWKQKMKINKLKSLDQSVANLLFT